MSVIVRNISKSFGEPPTKVLHELNFEIKDGEFVSISGRSGSGKTTLLYIVSTLDNPTTGELVLDGVNPSEMSVSEIHEFRNKKIGFIFQFHYLLPELSALENIILPTKKHNNSLNFIAKAKKLMDEFGLKDKYDRLPSQLSGGEQQRVAIARALIMEPKYIFADEPTGNLDTVNGEIVMNILKRVNKELGTTIVLVTHEPDYAKMASRQINLADGRLA